MKNKDIRFVLGVVVAIALFMFVKVVLLTN